MRTVFLIVTLLCLAFELPARAAHPCGGYLGINPGPVVLLCPGDTVRLNAVGFMVDPPFTWSTGQTGDFIEVSSPGHYYVFSADGCGHGWVEVIPFDSSRMATGFLDTICPGTSISLAMPFGNGVFSWADGSFPTPREVFEPGIYSLHVDLPCASWNVNFVVSEHDTSSVVLEDVYLCEPDTLFFDCPFTSCNWLAFTPNFDPMPITAYGNYAFRTFLPCKRMYSVAVLPDPSCSQAVLPEPDPSDCHPVLPNVFTPNLDGIGDLFGSETGCVFESWNLQVMDRWGRKMFESTDAMSGWDGKMGGFIVPEGVYFWTLHAINQGETVNDAGQLTLLR